MANSSFQIATTPKLYVSYPLFQYASGALDEYVTAYGSCSDEDMIKLLQIDPSNQVNLKPASGSFFDLLKYKLVPSYDNETNLVDSGLWNFDFCMLLGHNLNTQASMFFIKSAGDVSEQLIESSNIVNGDTDSTPLYDGWSLFSIDSTPRESDRFFTIEFWDSLSENLDFNLGSILWGKSYTFPQNVQLNTSTKFEYGVKQKSTISGKTISTANWTKPNNWITEPFGLTSEGQEGDNFQRRSGRRVWNMSFDSLAPDKVMPQNMMMNDNGYTPQDNHTQGATENSSLYNINNSEDFYSAVVHKTMGGHLPMVLQIDSNDNSPSGFAIVRMSSYTVTQKSPLLFSYSITLTEQI